MFTRQIETRFDILLRFMVNHLEETCFKPKLCSCSTGVKLDGKSIWKIHMDFFFENPFFLNLF